MSGPSGKVLLRMPASLHGLLMAEAERDGVSLNQFAVAALASAVRWKREDQPPVPSPQEREQLGRQREVLMEADRDGADPVMPTARPAGRS